MKQRVNLLGMCAFMAVLGVAVLFTACSKESVKKEVFTGYAQKGPFAAGSSVTISELQADLTQTGKTYITTVSDNLGSFELTDIEFVSNYVQIKVEGSFFHEFTGFVAGFLPMRLYTVVDISNVNSANVNVLTHLEKSRVEYLVKQEKKSFSAAKKQAQLEVLAIFGFTPSNTSSEALDLTNDGMLLAISCIFLAVPYYGETDLMELMANISEDIKTDGILNNTALGRKLVNCAKDICNDDGNDTFKLDRVRTNMETKYPNVTIPDFESYIQSFANSNLY